MTNDIVRAPGDEMHARRTHEDTGHTGTRAHRSRTRGERRGTAGVVRVGVARAGPAPGDQVTDPGAICRRVLTLLMEGTGGARQMGSETRAGHTGRVQKTEHVSGDQRGGGV